MEIQASQDHGHWRGKFVNRYGAGTMTGSVKFLFPIAGAMFLTGYSLLMFDILQARSLNRPAVLLTLASTLVFGIGLSGLFPMIIVQTGPVLFGGGLIGLGITTIRRRLG